MITCKHKRYADSRNANWVDHSHPHRLAMRKCGDCGALMSLGPANVTPEVEVEIRAAMLASTVGHWDMMNADERHGWLTHSIALQDIVTTVGEAGWLARVIATHGAES